MPSVKRPLYRDVIAQLQSAEPNGGGTTLTLGPRRTLEVSHLDKVYFPAPDLTKGALMRYYALVAPVLLPLVADRPLVLKRYPDGLEGSSFYQQNASDDTPDAVRVESILTTTGAHARRLVGGDLATLLYTVQLGAVEVHPWHSRVQSLAWADYAILDLDPGADVPFARLVDVALWIRALLDDAGLHGAVKTSGARGLHIVLPLPPRLPYTAAERLAETLARRVAESHPHDITVARPRAQRPAGTVYVDFLQNAEGKSVAAPFSVRMREQATVSTPLAWSELTRDLDPTAFTVKTIPSQARQRGALWARAIKRRNPLAALRMFTSPTETP